MLVKFVPSDASLPIPSQAPKEMLSVSRSDEGRTKVRINSSSLALIQECPRKVKYVLKERWVAESESPATLFGSAIHKALEVYYSVVPEVRGPLPKFEELELMSFGHPAPSEGLLYKCTSAFLEKAQPLSPLPTEDKRSLQSGVWLLWNYFKAYLDDPYVTYVDEKGPFVERPFSFILLQTPTLEVEYFGQIDLILQNKATGDLLVCDHKTSSIVGNDFYNRLKPNHQYTGYLLGAREAFGIKTDSFLINCLQVKEKPKTTRGTPPHLPRQITTRTEEDYQEFREVIKHAANTFIHWEETQEWPLGPTNVCANYGGCSFLPVCSAPFSLRENILKSKFRRADGSRN